MQRHVACDVIRYSAINGFNYLLPIDLQGPLPTTVSSLSLYFSYWQSESHSERKYTTVGKKWLPCKGDEKLLSTHAQKNNDE